MKQEARFAPPNAMVLIGDPFDSEVPPVVRGVLINSTSSCVLVGCQPDVDGDTELILGDVSDVDPGDTAFFYGKIDTPKRRVAIWSTHLETLLEMPVAQTETWVKVWVNDPRAPDKVIVGVE